MKKSIFTKYLPFVAAVLLSASCSKDNGGDSIINQPSSVEESAQSVQTPDESNTVAIPFSVRVSSGASLSKVKYTDKEGEVVDKVVEREFEPGDCGNIQLSVSGDGATALLDLKSKTEGDKTIYYFDGKVNVVQGKEESFVNGGIDLVGTFTTNSESTACYSTKSLLDLEQNVCKHVYKAEFKSDATSISLVDQNAYLCFTVAAIQTKFRLSFNGGEAQDFTPDATSHKIWIAVPCGGNGKATVKGALISDDSMDLEVGTAYDVNREDMYEEIGSVFVTLDVDGSSWASSNISDIKLSVNGDGATALLDLKSREEGDKTIYYFEGEVAVESGKEVAFKNGGIDLVGTFTTNGESTTCYSTTSLLDLQQNVCKHVYKAEYKSNATSITFVDQNAYLCFTVHEMQTEFTLSFNGEEIERTFVPNAETHKIWIAVPCGGDGKATVKGALISDDGMDLECGTVYDVDRHDKYVVFFVDLGTGDGILWSTCNLGAENPWEYGDYYAWGETDTKSNYSWSTYKYAKGSENTLKKYCDNSSYGLNGFTDNLTTLGAYEVNGEIVDDDVAHVTNDKWSMPTYEDFSKLRYQCYWVWTEDYNGHNVKGFIVYKAKGGDGGSITKPNETIKDGYDVATTPHIFLPASGSYDGTTLYDGYGAYWSSSLSTGGYPIYAQYFEVAWVEVQALIISQGGNSSRYAGLSVRPVRSMN